jgi:hypothetical protein
VLVAQSRLVRRATNGRGFMGSILQRQFPDALGFI